MSLALISHETKCTQFLRFPNVSGSSSKLICQSLCIFNIQPSVFSVHWPYHISSSPKEPRNHTKQHFDLYSSGLKPEMTSYHALFNTYYYINS